ncbi:MAG: Asp23/Gls24 family envelope stress response protein [Candidatus Omnitrophica bacterium]|nr:Asp23/Gls24 family envelope stress response protein [Candidatus Omnitrophota bacterium]
MNENTKTELGEVKIHKSVIASITIEATKQIPGVVKIGGNLKTYFFELLGRKDSTGIKIEFDKNGEAIITIPIVVKYEYNIPEIASKVQENVKLAVENSTNISIKDINVNIQEVEKAEI